MTTSDHTYVASDTELEALRRFPSPTIANAIELLNIRPRETGYTNHRIHCLFPELGPMVGYACTASILSAQPAGPQRRVDRVDYWKYVQSNPGPKIIAIQDMNEPAGGAYWGEVNGNIHRALGCIGMITNGYARDLEEVRPLRFHFFSGGVCVSHCWAHLEDFGRPISVFGMLIHPGDLIHADRHGAVIVPKGLVREVTAAAHEVERCERPIFQLCQSNEFSLESLDRLVPRDY